jgi:hypothetical protein
MLPTDDKWSNSVTCLAGACNRGNIATGSELKHGEYLKAAC